MVDAPVGVVGAVDCGTNSTRLLVTDDRGRALARLMRITRLGQGVDATGVLDPGAVERTIRVLAEYRSTLDELGAGRVRMVATSAVRDAANGQAFLDEASEVVGVQAELLSGLEEGRLAFQGATAELPPRRGDDVVVDIGGGSTELMASRDGALEVVSVDLGCVRLTERYLRHDPPKADELSAAIGAVDVELDRAGEAVPLLTSRGQDRRLIGLAGTVSTLSALDQGLAEYDRDRLHHSHLSIHAVAGWTERLGEERAEDRARHTGMVRGREDVIVGGALVLRQVMVRFGFDDCTVSESDILDGMAAELRGRPPSRP